MAQLRNLGMPFGSPGGIINIPAPAGSALAGQLQMQAMGGLGGGIGAYLGQRQQKKLWEQDLQNYQLAQQSGTAMPQMQSRRAQQMQQQSQLGQMFPPHQAPFTLTGPAGRYTGTGELIAEREPSPMTPTQELNQWRLGQLEGMTPEEQKQYMLKPPISITMPMGPALLTPEKRKELAEAEYEEKLTTKPLTPTEQKGVQTTIKDIMSEGKALPFGAKLGPALKQEDMERKWENTMEATGYAGRSKVQQRQIENEFDRYIGMLNKGKGVGVLAGQYQWDRRKYELKTNRNITKEQFDSALKKITDTAAKQRYINKNWRSEFGRRIE